MPTIELNKSEQTITIKDLSEMFGCCEDFWRVIISQSYFAKFRTTWFTCEVSDEFWEVFKERLRLKTSRWKNPHRLNRGKKKLMKFVNQ